MNTNPTKWSNTLKQFVASLPTNCLSVFDHFVMLALKGLNMILKHILIEGFYCSNSCCIFINICIYVIDHNVHMFLFFCRASLHKHWKFTGQLEKREGTFFFLSSTSTRSETFRYLFATLHVRWIPRISNPTTCYYQNGTWWDLLTYRTPIWLVDVDDGMLISVYMMNYF